MNPDCHLQTLNSQLLGLAVSCLTKAYADNQTYQLLLHAGRPGYRSRLRASFRHLLQLHLDSQSPVLLCRNAQQELVGVASMSSLFLRLEMQHHWLWRIKMMLTAGPMATQNFIQYFKIVASHLPKQQCRVITSLGVLPEHRAQGYGLALLQGLEQYADQDHDNAGLFVDTGPGRYLEFYQQQGFEPYAKLHFAELSPVILKRPSILEAKA